MYSAKDNEDHLEVCLTLIFKVNYGGQVTYVSHFEILKIGYFGLIDTKIWVCIMYPTHDEQGVTISNYDLDCQGHLLGSREKF